MCETDRQTERECVHSWSYPVGCGLRKTSVRATCVGGVRQTEMQATGHTLSQGHRQTHRDTPPCFHTQLATEHLPQTETRQRHLN